MYFSRYVAYQIMLKKQQSLCDKSESPEILLDDGSDKKPK